MKFEIILLKNAQFLHQNSHNTHDVLGTARRQFSGFIFIIVRHARMPHISYLVKRIRDIDQFVPKDVTHSFIPQRNKLELYLSSIHFQNKL